MSKHTIVTNNRRKHKMKPRELATLTLNFQCLEDIGVTLSTELDSFLLNNIEVFDMFVSNCMAQGTTGHVPNLKEAFDWSETPQGEFFWRRTNNYTITELRVTVLTDEDYQTSFDTITSILTDDLLNSSSCTTNNQP